MQTINEFIATNRLRMEVTGIGRNPNMADDDWSNSATHYGCTIRRDDGGGMYVPFSMGSAHTRPPALAEVLDCLASDAASIENARDFEEWAADLGYDTGSRKAETIWRTVQKQATSLRCLLGDSAYEDLLWNTERA